MRHLIVSREFPPAAYPAGGIGTYALNIARLLAKAGDVVHVIGQQWTGAAQAREMLLDGRLIIHRVPIDTPVEYASGRSTQAEIDLLLASANPAQAWNWNATILAEALVEREGIDAVEAQEWEAPLYFFLMRRALGLGPSRLPPCIIQLHSPSEFIWLHNEWSYGRPEFLPLARQEQYCIAAADALLCPSRYLARQSESHYGLKPGSVHLIPYPVGDFPAARRDDRSYESGAVLYAGRLEPRKGLIEFIEAAIAVARNKPDVVFEFAGSDVMYREGTVGQYLRARIPESLRPRFVFQGALSRPDLAARLGRARLAVVPSRWENFPNTCIEAMHAGLPVLVSPDGGMAEMVQDGRTGWVAASQRPADLEAGLRRALETPPEQRAAMGRAASVSIRQRCNDGRVTEAHQRWRRKVAAAGVGASLRLPAILPWAGARVHGEDRLNVRRPTPQDTVRIRSGAVALASTRATITTALSAMPEARVIVVARDGYVPAPDFADRACEIMATLPEVGIVSGWSPQTDDPASCAAFPYQWLKDGSGPVLAIRSTALPPRESAEKLPEPFAMWGLVNDVMAAGWKAITAPLIAGVRSDAARATTGAVQQSNDRELRRLLRARHPELVARDADALIHLLDGSAAPPVVAGNSHGSASGDRWTGLTPSGLVALSLGDKLALAAGAARNPRRTIAWLRDQLAARRQSRARSR